MLKRDELTDPNSCLNKAKDDELVFVLIETDPDAPGTILDWCRRRIESGKNKPSDAKIHEAYQIHDEMMVRRQNLKK